MSEFLPPLPSLLNPFLSFSFDDYHSIPFITFISAFNECVPLCFFKFPILQISLPSSNQIISIVSFILSFSMFFPFQKLSCICITIWIDQGSFSLHLIIIEFAFVLNWFHVEFTFSLLLVVFKVALVVPTIFKSKLTISMKFTILEFTNILSITKLKSTFAIFLIIFKVSFIPTLL